MLHTGKAAELPEKSGCSASAYMEFLVWLSLIMWCSFSYPQALIAVTVRGSDSQSHVLLLTRSSVVCSGQGKSPGKSWSQTECSSALLGFSCVRGNHVTQAKNTVCWQAWGGVRRQIHTWQSSQFGNLPQVQPSDFWHQCGVPLTFSLAFYTLHSLTYNSITRELARSADGW